MGWYTDTNLIPATLPSAPSPLTINFLCPSPIHSSRACPRRTMRVVSEWITATLSSSRTPSHITPFSSALISVINTISYPCLPISSRILRSLSLYCSLMDNLLTFQVTIFLTLTLLSLPTSTRPTPPASHSLPSLPQITLLTLLRSLCPTLPAPTWLGLGWIVRSPKSIQLPTPSSLFEPSAASSPPATSPTCTPGPPAPPKDPEEPPPLDLLRGTPGRLLLVFPVISPPGFPPLKVA